MWETLLPGSGTGFSQVVGYCLVRLFQRKKPTLTTPTLEKKLSNLGQFALIRYVIRWSHIAKSSWTNVVNWAFSTRFVVHPDWVKALTLQYRRGNVANFTIKTIRRKQIEEWSGEQTPKGVNFVTCEGGNELFFEFSDRIYCDVLQVRALHILLYTFCWVDRMANKRWNVHIQ